MNGNQDTRLALTESSQSGEERVMEQPRQPRNMEDLLRYAIQAESQNPSTVPDHDLGPLDPQRRMFLENVISSMTVDVVKELKTALSVLQRDYKVGESMEPFEDAFEQILDFIDNIDLANDFFKLGGFDVCKTWLEKGPPGARWRAANVIGECCQNNPFCQSEAVKCGFLKMLMELAQNDKDEMVKVKAFHAVSCIVRNNDATLKHFLNLNGHNLILGCLQSSSYKMKTKASFFTSVVADKEVALRQRLWDIGVAEELATLIRSSQETRLVDDVACFEQCLSALNCMLKHSNGKLKQEKSTVESLNHLVKILSRQPSYLESVDYMKSILTIIEPRVNS